MSRHVNPGGKMFKQIRSISSLICSYLLQFSQESCPKFHKTQGYQCSLRGQHRHAVSTLNLLDEDRKAVVATMNFKQFSHLIITV